MNDLLTILTVRTDSERFPGKILEPVKSVAAGVRKVTLPLGSWIIRRLKEMPGELVVATTTDRSDDELVRLLKRENVPIHRGPVDDVIGRMQEVVEKSQGCDFVLRALGDCPFLSLELVDYSIRAMSRTRSDAFVYYMNPEVWPVYGSREFPYSIDAWLRIVGNSEHREHPDQYFHENRRQFQVLYHQPPPNIYMRPYRLEVDWPEDLVLISAIADEIGMMAPVDEVVKFLDGNPDIARINANRIEKTGPLSLNSYSNSKRRQWLVQMQGKPVMGWDGKITHPPDKRATPIFCSCGHPVGQGWQGRLYLPDGSLMDSGFPKCRNCGLITREWKEAA